MKTAKYYIFFLVSCLFNANAYSDASDTNILTFPEALGHSTWQEPKYKHYHEGSKPYQLNDLYESFGDSETDIINALGKPIKRVEREIPNRHDSEYNVKLIQLFYDGLVIELLTNHHDVSFVNRIFISDCNMPSDFQLYLCLTVDVLKDKLGQPSIETDSELTYLISVGDIGTVPLRIFFSDGVVTGIYANSFID